MDVVEIQVRDDMVQTRIFAEHLTNSCNSYRCLFEARDVLLLAYGFPRLFQLYCIKIVGTDQCF